METGSAKAATEGVRFVALGDSFTEGVGDDYPEGGARGWADLVAKGWATGVGEPIRYANLAIRGRLVWPIVEEQLEPALALRPTHLSFNGGGNDMLRPRIDLPRVVAAYERVASRCAEEGVQLVVLSGAMALSQLPFSGVIHRRGEALSRAVEQLLVSFPGVVRAFNWYDTELRSSSFWSADRLHMNARGHHRVAARVLDALGVDYPYEWWSWDEEAEAEAAPLGRAAYYREHVVPWVRRRLTGRSSGDGRVAKHPDWVEIVPF